MVEKLFRDLESTAIRFDTAEDFNCFLRIIHNEYPERWFRSAHEWHFDNGRYSYISINPYNGMIALSERHRSNGNHIYTWEEVKPLFMVDWEATYVQDLL